MLEMFSSFVNVDVRASNIGFLRGSEVLDVSDSAYRETLYSIDGSHGTTFLTLSLYFDSSFERCINPSGY
jgi:hypothetical protein